MESDASAKNLEAAKMINDWAKWLVTIETAAIALIGAFFTRRGSPINELAQVLATLAIISFVISIAGAASLLLTLPEIIQNLEAGQNIWLTRDSVAGSLLRLDTQRLAMIEAVFFGIGLVLLGSMMLVLIWG